MTSNANPPALADTGRTQPLPSAAPSGPQPPLLVVPLSAGPAHGQLAPLDLPPRPNYLDPVHPLRRAELAMSPELVLTDILQECHYIMRDVALRTLLPPTDVQDRLAFTRSAMDCAETAGSLAKAIARMRALPMDEDRKLALTVEAAKLVAEKEKAKS